MPEGLINLLIQIPLAALVAWALWVNNKDWREYVDKRDVRFEEYVDQRDSRLNETLDHLKTVIEANTAALARYETMGELADLCRELRKELKLKNGG